MEAPLGVGAEIPCHQPSTAINGSFTGLGAGLLPRLCGDGYRLSV
jgi:hypothetical protein